MLFGLEPAELVAVGGFALTTLGMLIRISMLCGRIVQGQADHSRRLANLERAVFGRLTPKVGGND